MIVFITTWATFIRWLGVADLKRVTIMMARAMMILKIMVLITITMTTAG